MVGSGFISEREVKTTNFYLLCGEIFLHDKLSCGEVSPHVKSEENLSHRESSPHDEF